MFLYLIAYLRILFFLLLIILYFKSTLSYSTIVIYCRSISKASHIAYPFTKALANHLFVATKYIHTSTLECKPVTLET